MHISCPFAVSATCQIVMFSWIHLLILFSDCLSLFIACLVTFLCMPKLEDFYPDIIYWYPMSQLAAWLFFLCSRLSHGPRISVCSRSEIIGQGFEASCYGWCPGSIERKNRGIRRLHFSVYLLRNVKYAFLLDSWQCLCSVILTKKICVVEWPNGSFVRKEKGWEARGSR